jgi:hypothetical protein
MAPCGCRPRSWCVVAEGGGGAASGSLEGAGQGAELWVDEKPVQDAVAAGAFAGSGGGELFLHLLEDRGLGAGERAVGRSKVSEPGGVGWQGGFFHGASAGGAKGGAVAAGEEGREVEAGADALGCGALGPFF